MTKGPAVFAPPPPSPPPPPPACPNPVEEQPAPNGLCAGVSAPALPAPSAPPAPLALSAPLAPSAPVCPSRPVACPEPVEARPPRPGTGGGAGLGCTRKSQHADWIP